MRRAALLIVPSLAICGALAACGPSSPGAEAPQTTPMTTVSSVPLVAAPPLPTPAATGTCPYLDPVTAEDDNGQHVTTVKLSAPDGQSEPSCFFYRPDGNWQLTVWVYDGSADVAKAIVNQQAPVATSNPASDPAGWNGGSEPTSTGAIYAVAKGGKAVVVISNQKQTIKTRLVTDHVVSTLGW
jgi:hypothetical protein